MEQLTKSRRITDFSHEIFLNISSRVAGLNPNGHCNRSCPIGPRLQVAGAIMKTLFLQAPSYDGFDGGAGSRYQAKREIRSFWYPTWLAQPAALVPDRCAVRAGP
jgi:hypothetical protein